MMQGNSIILSLHNLQLPFSNTWKYGILALAILLFLVAVIILTCQMCQLWKPRRLGKKRKRLNEAWNGIKTEDGILRKNIQPSLLDIAQKSYSYVKIQKLKEELDKLGTCFSPSSTSIENLDSMGSNAEVRDNARARLRFSILYHREQLELFLMVIEATGLPSQRSTDYAVRIRLLKQVPSPIAGLQRVVHEWQTQVVKNSRTSVFGDHFACSLPEAELEKSTVKLEVKHFNKYSRHTVLGEVRVMLSQLKSCWSMEFCEELQKTTKDIVGEILVSLKCLPISQRIEVGLLKARTASLCSRPDKNVYAQIDVFCSCHKQKHQKSRPQAQAPIIVFNETFLFHLPEPITGDCTVLISIYKMDSPASRQLVGQASLGKSRTSETNEHWALMFQSIQQPVAKWHPLLI